MPPGIGYGKGVNRNTQKFGVDAVRRRLQGMRQSAGMVGVLGRGKNTYGLGRGPAARTGGGPGIGRPVGSRDENPLKATINRRIARRRRM